MTYNDMIEAERARYERAPMRELRAVRVSLAIHSWGNTVQEKARAEAVEQLVSARLRAKGRVEA